jgi:hypothetical protein
MNSNVPQEIRVPENFRTIIVDFTTDLSATFPEYAYLWSKWQNPALSEEELTTLFNYCITVYPERFFDVLNQNIEIFESENETNTKFLPDVDFKLLYSCEGVSENTKKTLWKYMQLILFTIVGGIQDKTTFGEAMNMFEGIDENILQDKLKDAMDGISSFFSKEAGEGFGQAANENQDQDQDQNRAQSQDKTGLPDFENMQDHLKSLFGGKIGSLAQEMAEEISGEFKDLLGGEDMGDVKNTEDVLKKLMKNPKKIMDLVKTVGGKLDAKMKNGEISKEELMKEATDMMKNMGGMDKFGDMFKEMAKNMGGMGGMGCMGGMGGLGKNMRVDTNAMTRMAKQQEMKDKMLAKLRAKQEAQAKFSVQPTETANNFVFKLNEEASQEKSYIHPDILKEMEQEDAKQTTKKTGDGNKKKKGKKGK